jgi:hypothetical protein
MKLSFLSGLLIVGGLFLSAGASAQDRTVIAGIPVNYDEAQTGDYRIGLPDPLVMLDGRPVTTSRQWFDERRPEIVRLFETYQYGKWPAEKPPLRYTVRQDEGLNGTAVRKQVTLYFSPDDNGPRVDVLIYLPKDANGPVPLLLNLNFAANNLAVNDPGVQVGRNWDVRTKTASPATPANGRVGRSMNETIAGFLREGFGFATLHYTDIDPDFLGGVPLGVRSLYLKPGQTEPAADEWGSISAWAWGVSNVMDYFEVDPAIDAARIALTGASRLGKTTMWAGAREPRIAVVLASCSGEGGAAISRRNFGETVAHLTEGTRYPYQFAANYGNYGADVTRLPVDANLLVSLIAPRPLLLQTGTTDNWSDPIGEFLAAVEGGKVYRLLGKDDLGTTELPAPDQPIYHTLGYFMHEGGHGTIPLDWQVYLEFMKRYL